MSDLVGPDTMDGFIGTPSVVRMSKGIEAPAVYADLLTLGGFRLSSYLFKNELGDFAIGYDIQELEIAGRSFSDTQTISSTLSILRTQNIDLITDSHFYRYIFSLGSVFENICEQKWTCL